MPMFYLETSKNLEGAFNKEGIKDIFNSRANMEPLFGPGTKGRLSNKKFAKTN